MHAYIHAHVHTHTHTHAYGQKQLNNFKKQGMHQRVIGSKTLLDICTSYKLKVKLIVMIVYFV